MRTDFCFVTKIEYNLVLKGDGVTTYAVLSNGYRMPTGYVGMEYFPWNGGFRLIPRHTIKNVVVGDIVKCYLDEQGVVGATEKVGHYKQFGSTPGRAVRNLRRNHELHPVHS